MSDRAGLVGRVLDTWRQRWRRIGRTAAAVAILTTMASPMSSANAPKNEMPDSFVYLRAVDPSIEQDMRYAGRDNFTGRPVPGYDAAECVLVRQAAEALKAAQAELKPMGLSLKVYDCYRPAMAVAAFVAWSKEPDDPGTKRTHYPMLSKDQLFPEYIATRSGHSRGATLDITIVPLDSTPSAAEADPVKAEACTAGDPADNSLDMGTGFDCFDPKANTDTPGLTKDQQDNRELLLEVMNRYGFKNYPQEIWHYTFEPEPYPDTYFDFPILPRPAGDPE